MLELDNNYQHNTITDLIVWNVEEVLELNRFRGINGVLKVLSGLDVIYGSSGINANHWYVIAKDVYINAYGNTGEFNPPGFDNNGEMESDSWMFDSGSRLSKFVKHFTDYFYFSMLLNSELK
jgi:hypothetical protein